MAGEEAKAAVLKRLAGARHIVPLPKHRVKLGDVIVHTRFRSAAKKGGTVWSFNINPNTLTADFELWVCGSKNAYYLIPRERIHEIYNAPNGWTDYAHPEIKVAEVDTRTHACAYRKGPGIDFGPYYLAHLLAPAP